MTVNHSPCTPQITSEGTSKCGLAAHESKTEILFQSKWFGNSRTCWHCCWWRSATLTPDLNAALTEHGQVCSCVNYVAQPCVKFARQQSTESASCNMLDRLQEFNSARATASAARRAWACPLSETPAIHDRMPDKRKIKADDVAYLEGATVAVVGKTVCKKCYNRRTTAKRKVLKILRDENTPPPTDENIGSCSTGSTDLRVAELERQLRRSEMGRKAALRQVRGGSVNGTIPSAYSTVMNVPDSLRVDAGWNTVTSKSTRYKYIKETVDFIGAKAKAPTIVASSAPTDAQEPAFVELERAVEDHPMAVALGDIIGCRRMKHYLPAALKRAGFSPAESTPPAAANNTDRFCQSCATCPGKKRRLIDAHTAVEFKYSAGIKSRGAQAMRNTLGELHATVTEIRDHTQELYDKHCPKAFCPAIGNPGVAVSGPETVERMLEQDFYWDRLDQSGKRAGLYINMMGYDGVQQGEYTKDSVCIMGNKPLNVKYEGYKGLESQSTSMYIPNAIVPLTESKVALESAYSVPTSQWDTPGLILRPKGRPPLTVVNIAVQDDSSCSKADKCTGTSSLWFCWKCTLTKDAWRQGLTENTLVDDDTLVLRVEADGPNPDCTHDTNDCECTFETVSSREAVRYPVKERVFDDPNCDHDFWNHSCACKKHLAKVIEDRFDWTDEEFRDAIAMDKIALREETERMEAVVHKEGDLGLSKTNLKKKVKAIEQAINGMKQEVLMLMDSGDEANVHAESLVALDALMVERALLKEGLDRRGFHALSKEKREEKQVSIKNSIKKSTRFNEVVDANPDERKRALHDPKHRDHDKILPYSKRFTWGQSGECLERNGTSMKVNDPFHLAYNTLKGQQLKVLMDAYSSLGLSENLQLWLFKIGLKHIDLGDKDQHKAAWLQWTKRSHNRDNLKSPADTREDMNGMECKVLFAQYEGAIDVLTEVAMDKALVAKTSAVLLKVHELYKPLFSHLKATKNFLPLVDGKAQNPAPHYRKCVEEYDTYFKKEVNSSNGFTVNGIDLLMQPWHVMKDHVADWMDELFEKYGLYYGELSCEVVEHYNKVVCRHLENSTNNGEKVSEDKSKPTNDNKYYQTLRHFLVQIFCYHGTLFKKRRENLICSVCHEKGHQKNNAKECKMNPEYKPGYGIVYGDN